MRPPAPGEPVPVDALEAAFGYTREELLVVLRPMWREGTRADRLDGRRHAGGGPVDVPRPLFHYFKQRFAEVTNPPIDSLREEIVMSLSQVLGRRGCMLIETPEAARLLEIHSPILSDDDLAALRSLGEAGSDQGIGLPSGRAAKQNSP